MINDILEIIPEEKRAEIKVRLDKLVDLDGLTPETFAGLRKSNKAIDSVFQAELSTLNERYRTEKVPAIVDKMVAEKIAAANPETDPDKIKARLESESDPTKRDALQARYETALLKKQMAELTAERERLAKVEEKAKRSNELKSYIESKKYEGIDPADYADFDSDYAMKLIDKHAGVIQAKLNALEEKYKGLGNGAPNAGARTTTKEELQAMLKDAQSKGDTLAVVKLTRLLTEGVK